MNIWKSKQLKGFANLSLIMMALTALMVLVAATKISFLSVLTLVVVTFVLAHFIAKAFLIYLDLEVHSPQEGRVYKRTTTL